MNTLRLIFRKHREVHNQKEAVNEMPKGLTTLCWGSRKKHKRPHTEEQSTPLPMLH